jgi:23S rRNA pseudouridine955/2504/2580 synthase
MTKLLVEELIETRLDRFLRRKFVYLTQGIIEKTLRKGQIKVNDKNAKASTRVRKGDIVIIADYLINEENHTLRKKNYFSPAVISLSSKILKEYLIFSCEEFIAINKPNGVAAQGGSKITISIDHALQYLNETENNEYRLVHRIDKDTSGIFIIAKNLNSTILLGEAFREKQIKKTYLAIVSGNAYSLPKEGSIESYISKEKSGIHEIVKETKDGKFAHTSYKILATNQHMAAIKYTPLTGRMHQLRYHSKQLGFPILGDMKYGNLNFKRMMLHALEIFIPEKIFGQEYVIKAPLDNTFVSCLQELDNCYTNIIKELYS